jgi:hypothetical protein
MSLAKREEKTDVVGSVDALRNDFEMRFPLIVWNFDNQTRQHQFIATDARGEVRRSVRFFWSGQYCREIPLKVHILYGFYGIFAS